MLNGSGANMVAVYNTTNWGILHAAAHGSDFFHPSPVTEMLNPEAVPTPSRLAIGGESPTQEENIKI